MHAFYEEFIKLLEAEKREKALKFVISKLKNNEIDILTLYLELLAPALNSMEPHVNNKAFIWREHVRSSIIRTIIENCYLYVIKERDEKYLYKTNKRVAVVCPTEEYHEIGARMVSDFFTLLGYEAIFVGSNTPKEEFIEALDIINLDYIALSVSNNYNLIAARKTVEKIKETAAKVKILVGGHAFENNEEYYKDVGADMHISNFKDIVKLAEEDKL